MPIFVVTVSYFAYSRLRPTDWLSPVLELLRLSWQAIFPGSLLAMVALFKTYRMRMALDRDENSRVERAGWFFVQCLVLGPVLGFCALTLDPPWHYRGLRDSLAAVALGLTWTFGLFELGRVVWARGRHPSD